MGALKHVLIPFFTLLHLVGFYKALDPVGFVDFCGIPLLQDEVQQTIREVHMIGVIMSFHLAMAFMCAMGFLHESAHFRGVVMVWEVLFYGVRSWNSHQLGLDTAKVTSKPALAAAVGVVGLILHSMEPGLFTKDKTSKKDKKT